MAWVPWGELSSELRVACYVGATVLAVIAAVFFPRFLNKRREYSRYKRRGLLALLIVAIVFAGLMGASASFAHPPADTVVAQGSLLLAYSNKGEIAWAKVFPSDILTHSRLEDLDGNGTREVVVATRAQARKASKLIIVDETGQDIINSEVANLDWLHLHQPYVPYSSREFEIVDLLIEDFDGLEGKEILFLANDPSEESAPSIIVGVKPNGELSACYWHFGRLRQVEFFGNVDRWRQPSIVVLGENNLVGEKGHATVVFALCGEKFFSDDVSCWNLISTMVADKGLEVADAWEQYRDEDIAFSLGCGETMGPLAWYKWIEPIGVTVVEMRIGWVTYVVAPGASWHLEEYRFITLDLGDGCVIRIPQDGKWSQLEAIGGAECRVVPRLAP